MKKLLFGLAAVAALLVTAKPAAAQYPPPGYGGYPAPGYGYGYAPQAGGCANCGDAGHGWGFGLKSHFLGLFGNYGGGGRNVNTLPAVDPRSGNAGQLAYPHNPFFRGPRDYFMWDEK
jgi:hypothetical protein